MRNNDPMISVLQPDVKAEALRLDGKCPDGSEDQQIGQFALDRRAP
jgi:hypothetical protein